MTELIAGGPVCVLGEGPRWDDATSRLAWVDIDQGLLLQASLHGHQLGPVTSRQVAPTLGAATPGPDGSVLAAAHDRLVVLTSDGQRSASRQLVPAGHRFNDGAVDPAGRYLVGTLSLGETTWDEQLIRLELDGSVTVIDDDLGLSNGLAWSTDGTRFFSVDTERNVVFVRDYDVSSGAVGERRTWIEVADGYPDGIWVDTEDHVWVAVWGGGVVHRFSPKGEKVASAAVPAPHSTAVTFAGPDHDVLVVTSATTGLTDAQLEQCPLSGQTFTAAAPVAGLACTPWSPGPLPL